MRDVKVRYKQTALGALWALIQPIAMMIILTAIRKVMGLGGAADPVLIYAALLPWFFFASSVTASTNSLVANANMLRKVYFPRLIVPLASVGAPLVDYFVAFLALIGLMAWYGLAPTAAFLLLPLCILSTIIAALGVGILLSALTVSYRDFRYVAPFLVQVLFFLSPVLYTAADVPETYRWILGLNPMGGVIEAFRSVVLGHAIDWSLWLSSTQVGMVCLLVGLWRFSRAERLFADVI